MERLHGGMGIMCDDLVAGVYAAVVVLVAIVSDDSDSGRNRWRIKQRKQNRELSEREAEATDKETLKDLQDCVWQFGQYVTEDRGDVPSPDGSFDDDRRT